MLNLFTGLKLNTILAISGSILFLVVGTFIGIPIGKVIESGHSAKLLAAQKSTYEAAIASHLTVEKELVANRDKWKLALENAQIDAIKTAKILEKNNETLSNISSSLKTINTKPIIVKELNNACKSSDIIVNTDSSDRLRNCLSSADPATCSAP